MSQSEGGGHPPLRPPRSRSSNRRLDDGAQAIFETIYNDAGWNGGAAIVYQGGLVDSATGQELPDANTGIYTMPAGQATGIDWSNEDALLNIDWSVYRNYCHRALLQ